jgi:hypothetical protein
MHFEIAIVGVGLARKEALDLSPLRLLVKHGESGLGLGDNRRVTFGLAEADQFDSFLDLALDAAIAVDRLFQSGTLAQYFLRLGRVVPELGVFRLGVQLGEAAVGDVPVKDASSAAPTTSGCRRRPPVSQRA